MCAVCWEGAQVVPVAAVAARLWFAGRRNRADAMAGPGAADLAPASVGEGDPAPEPVEVDA